MNVDPMIFSVSAAAESSTARRARNASSTVSLNRTSVMHAGAEDLDRDHHDFARLGDSRGQVRALSSDEADLAEEPSRRRGW